MNILSHAVFFASVLTACLAAYPEISKLEVEFGNVVYLPCFSSMYGNGTLDVQWEAMGKDVAFFQNGQLTAGQGYEGRVELEKLKALEGDFTLTLRNAVMSDTDLYECLWQGKKSISTVTLNILPPPFPTTHIIATEGDNVTLPCYGKIPKNKPWEKMFIQWLKDDEEILLLSSGEITTNSGQWNVALPTKEVLSQGILSLTIEAVRASDQGIYKCRYKTNDFEAPRSGYPEAHSLDVLVSEKFMPLTTEAFNATEMSSFSTSTELTGFIADASEENTTTQNNISVTSELQQQPNSTTDFIGLIADASFDSTTMQVITEVQPLTSTTTDLFGLIADVSSDSTTEQDNLKGISDLLLQPSVTTDITGLTADDSGDKTVQDTLGGEENLEFLWDEKVPWVRIGIISGVLLVTAAFLGILVALGNL